MFEAVFVFFYGMIMLLLAYVLPQEAWYKKNNHRPIIRDVALTLGITFWPLSICYGIIYKMVKK